jgi:hypothetical protein
MMYYYDEDLYDDEDLYEEYEEDLHEGWNEELYEEYVYGLDKKTLWNKLAPDPRENPSQFSKLGVYKLQNLAKDYKYLLIEVKNDVKPNAKLFYTVRFWWVNAKRDRKKLVDWTIYGPTNSTFIAIPVNDIIGIYSLKGYHMSSDIFIEYRVDEEVLRWGVRKVLERRFAEARFTKEDKKENKSDDIKKKQEKKPTTPSTSSGSTSSGTQKPKEQTDKPQKPESKPKEDTPVFIRPVQPTSRRMPILWILIGLGIVGALIFWIEMKNRR